MPKQKKLCLNWQPHKAELQNLYLVQDLPLERLMRHMEETHGFRATKAQYETQLKKWNIRKNLTNEEWNYTLLQVRKRKFDGKESDVYLNGRVVPEKRIKKEMSRHFTLTQEQLLDTVSIPSTPEAITVSTPAATVSTAAGLFPMNPAQSPRIGATRQIALDSQVINLPSFTDMDSNEWDALALFQGISSSLLSTVNEEGKILLAGLFGPKTQADSNEFLTQIRSRMLVSSLERYDGELLEKSQLLCGPSKQSSVLRILEFALYRISNNLLSAKATDEFTRWLIKQQQSGLLASFLKTKIPTVHACATKIIESVLSIGDAEFLELLIDSGIDTTPLKSVCGGRHLVQFALKGNMQIVQILLKAGADVNILLSERYPYPALYAATSVGHAHIVQVLLKAGANVDAASLFRSHNTALSKAVYYKNIVLIRILLTAGANIDNCIVDDISAIEYSALNIDDDELHQLLLSASSKEYSSISSHGVMEAASTGTQALSRYLVEKGKTGALVHEVVLESAFIAACRGLRYDAVISLLDLGIDPNCSLPSNIGLPLQNAVHQGDLELVKILLQAGAEVKTPKILYSAMDHDMRVPHGIKMRQFMLDEGAKGANFEIHREAALRYAAYKGYFEVAQSFVFSGVNVNAENYGKDGFTERTVLQNAVSGKDIELVKFLLDARADVNAISWLGEGQTALEIAIRDVSSFGRQKLAMVEVLLAAGADVNIPDEERLDASILQCAVANGDEELVSILLKEGADVNSPPLGDEGRSPVQAAATRGNLSLIKLLLESGADINAPAGDYYGRTALQAALSSELPAMELINFLLDAGADINAPAGGYYGRTALQAALSSQLPAMELINFLLDAGADINAPAGDYFGRTALQAALSSELPAMELIDFLLDAGADVNAPAGEEGGLTALQGAAIGGHMKIALKLLEAGADVNADPAAYNGRTALDGAAEHGRLDMVQMLLNAGACGDSTKSHRFEEAIELARDNGHFAIVSLLERA